MGASRAGVCYLRGDCALPPPTPYHLISGDITFHGSGGATDSRLSSVSARVCVSRPPGYLIYIAALSQIPVGVVSDISRGSGMFRINSVEGRPSSIFIIPVSKD